MIETITSFHNEHQAVLGIIAGLSALMLVASILGLPYLVSLIPTDYYQSTEPYRSRHEFKHPVLRLSIIVSKNILGWFMVVMGIIMLVLPGQGLITLAFGLMLIDFPGKRIVECWLIGNPRILRAINWLRAKRGREPLLPPEHE